ncbi:MAG: hypothetical protein ACRELF_17855 [Gemmataceae bacterium]
MALIPYLYIGHFIAERSYVRFQDHKPAVTRPLEMPTVLRLLRKYLGDSANPEELPDDWAMSILLEDIVCNHYGSAAPALRLAADYAQQEGATILDLGSFSLMTPEQLRQSVALLSQARPA